MYNKVIINKWFWHFATFFISFVSFHINHFRIKLNGVKTIIDLNEFEIVKKKSNKATVAWGTLERILRKVLLFIHFAFEFEY